MSLQTSPGIDVALATQAILRLRTARAGNAFFTDGSGVDALPKWVKTARQTTDGHLVALAEAHGAKLATFDRGMPGTLLIA